ncbi:ABC transporter ATP-binding protein [Lachnospiraceae bacterium MD1]|uniref:ABC transporter ATP-binding protein n=2 Tax=Variimorphobacter saccharofermentans TaxID=2755051 RepID=A0A839K3F2_9FIRM|nr:ABC transporter ATP-binding protein [Variimorphobacter saccharofermentans]
MEAIITLNNIEKSFGEKQVLKKLNLSVSKGEIFGLLGPSGAGKTTIIKILTGQIKPTSGEATILGTNTRYINDKVYAKIGMVLDNSGLYSRLSCYDNLLMFSSIYGIDKKKIKEVLKKVELSEAIRKPVSKLSKGMVQRLVLARAIMHKPELLFLDEPTSGIDPATCLKIHQLLLELKESGTTIFLTTHNMEEASKLCDHIALLNEGEVVEYGEPDALCRKYNEDKKITILLKNGQLVTLQNGAASSKQIYEYFASEEVESIHSSEPNLETVFIALTGKELS